jgi:hypothetical protein
VPNDQSTASEAADRAVAQNDTGAGGSRNLEQANETTTQADVQRRVAPRRRALLEAKGKGGKGKPHHWSETTKSGLSN